jgi:hypothetical protein
MIPFAAQLIDIFLGINAIISQMRSNPFKLKDAMLLHWLIGFRKRILNQCNQLLAIFDWQCANFLHQGFNAHSKLLSIIPLIVQQKGLTSANPQRVHHDAPLQKRLVFWLKAIS